jgi:hypothetical protein
VSSVILSPQLTWLARARPSPTAVAPTTAKATITATEINGAGAT